MSKGPVLGLTTEGLRSNGITNALGGRNLGVQLAECFATPSPSQAVSCLEACAPVARKLAQRNAESGAVQIRLFQCAVVYQEWI